jgi:hypothetical protein
VSRQLQTRAYRWGYALGTWAGTTILFIILFAAMKILLALALQQPWNTGYEYPAAVPSHILASMLLGWVYRINATATKEEPSERKEP